MNFDNGTIDNTIGTTFDPQNLEIKTKSIEQTLVPLVTQITALVNFKENIISNGKPKSERAIRGALKVGSAVEAAIERFVAVGETIADENPDIQPEMYDACREARYAGSSIANLNGSIFLEDPSSGGSGAVDKAVLVKAARQLLSSVTRVLLLADRVLVKHILRAEDKVAFSLTKLENCSHFTEFVKIFTEFGGEMVDLAHRSGDRQNDLKSDKRRAQMACARTSLERLTMLLLTASKTLLRHPDDQGAKQCRDGVFHYLRLNLQLIGLCVTDGVVPYDISRYYTPLSFPSDEPLDIGLQLTASVTIKQLNEMLEMVRLTGSTNVGIRERLIGALDQLCEMTQDFTDSPITPHHQREQILDYLEECRFEMSNLIVPASMDDKDGLCNDNVEVSVERLNRRLGDLKKQLQAVALEQVASIFRENEDHNILTSIKACSVSGDIDGVEKFLQKFKNHTEHVQDVCRLLHHVSLTDSLHVYSGQTERTLRALSPLTLFAGRTLCIHPSSRIARENLEVFCDTWAQNISDLSRLAREFDTVVSGRVAAEKQAYMSLPRPGVGYYETSCNYFPSTSMSSNLNNMCNNFPSESYASHTSSSSFYSEPSPEISVSMTGDSAFVSMPYSCLSSSITEYSSDMSKSYNNSVQNSTYHSPTTPIKEKVNDSVSDNRKDIEFCLLKEHDCSKSAFTIFKRNQHDSTSPLLLSPITKEVLTGCLDENKQIVEDKRLGTPPLPIKKHGTTTKPSKPITLDVEDQQKIAKVGLEMKLLTSEVDAEAEKWDEYAENDIVKRAKSMSSMAYNMYLFTRGDGPLKTTHDLFTQAEFFAEQANKMYKTVKEFHYEVPGSPEKSDLMNVLERIPLHCQQLQVLVKSPTVGKSATFGKVDSVIQETKNLMNEIAKLVTSCFVCATKFEIEFRGTGSTRSTANEGDSSHHRMSRESTLWRRTPSTRRTAPPPNIHHHSSHDLQSTAASEKYQKIG
ncbi:Alpha-catulin [Strongyloides ratti]|uniref:Alpha-catulin n=1 Tax=Strongyloides ratti TaxID=34506 RepID=A0A090LM49_STRRB|nr:Alpha-catulin [Strongyloides ratti]CEF68630.1 Alpha-catulin [Strongyloides ratti]